MVDILIIFSLIFVIHFVGNNYGFGSKPEINRPNRSGLELIFKPDGSGPDLNFRLKFRIMIWTKQDLVHIGPIAMPRSVWRARRRFRR